MSSTKRARSDTGYQHIPPEPKAAKKDSTAVPTPKDLSKLDIPALTDKEVSDLSGYNMLDTA